MKKKIILNVSYIVLTVFILDFAIGRTLRYLYFKENAGLDYRTTYAMDKTKADLLVFGSSSANHQYVPEIFEDSLKLSCYNTGREGMGILYQTAILKAVLNRYTPRIIILDYRGVFEKGSADYDRLSILLPYYRPHKEIREIVELKSPFERLKLISEIYPFNSLIFRVLVGSLEFNKKRLLDDKGYLPIYNEWQNNIDSVEFLRTYKIDSNKVRAFQEFITLAKKSGAKLFVIHSPVFIKYIGNQEIDIGKEFCYKENVPFWDYSKDTLFLNNNHLFYDPAHLNHYGAMIFSDIVVREMKRDLEKAILGKGISKKGVLKENPPNSRTIPTEVDD